MDETRAHSTFDRFHAQVDGLPDVTSTKPSAIKQTLPLAGQVTTQTVQTFKGAEFGFAIAITVVDADGQAYNHILPDRVARAIYRQAFDVTRNSVLIGSKKGPTPHRPSRCLTSTPFPYTELSEALTTTQMRLGIAVSQTSGPLCSRR